MDLDNCKQDWKDHHKNLADDQNPTDIFTQAITMERSMLRSDRIELCAAVLSVVVLIVILALDGLSIVMKLGLAIGLLTGVAGALGLHLSRKKDPKPNPELPLEGFCRAELKRIERRIELLRKFWRFTLPMTIGCCIFTLGMFLEFKRVIPTLSNAFFFGWQAPFYLCFLLAMFVIKRGYERAIRNQYAPIRDDLLQTINSLTESGHEKTV